METIKIDGLYDLAKRAHSGTSFSPAKRAETTVTDYENELTNDLSGMPESRRERYKKGYIKHLFAYLGVRTRIVSPMIAGPSNFPGRQMEKYSRWEDNKYKEFTEWRERALKAIEKDVRNSRPEAQVIDENWVRMERKIQENAAVIQSIDAGNSYYTRSLFVNSITGLIKRTAESGDILNTNRALELLRKLNSTSTKPIIADKNSVWGYEQRAEAAKEVASDKKAQESKEIAFEGGKMILNYAIDRVQIQHDVKPAADIIASLKKAAFRWSPSEGAWQRQLTNAGLYAAQQITKVTF